MCSDTPLIAVFLAQGETLPLSASVFTEQIMNWNIWYETLYGNFFSEDIEKERHQLRSNIEKFLNRCDLKLISNHDEFRTIRSSECDSQ